MRSAYVSDNQPTFSRRHSVDVASTDGRVHPLALDRRPAGQTGHPLSSGRHGTVTAITVPRWGSDWPFAGVYMRPKAALLILLVLLGVLTSPLRAQQTGTVSGTLTNSLSGDPVANALIVLEGGPSTRQTRTG